MISSMIDSNNSDFDNLLYIDHHQQQQQDQQIRLLQPEIWQKLLQLQQLIQLFFEKNDDFKKIVTNFIESLNEIRDKIESEKIKAIGSRSLIKALEMKRDSLREQFRNMIREKKIELERMQLEYELLRKEELQQQNLLMLLRQSKG